MQFHRVRVLAVAAVLVGSLSVPFVPAAADGPATFTVVGQAQLGGGMLNAGTGCFEGVAVGGHAEVDLGPPHSVTVDPALARTASATFWYDNTAGLTGTAAGQLTIELDSGAEIPADFLWERVGTVAVVSLFGSHFGSAVATIVPTTAVNNAQWVCQPLSGSDEFAIVAGVGVLS